MNNIIMYQKKFEHERSYLFCINNINTKSMYSTTYSDHFRNYNKLHLHPFIQVNVYVRQILCTKTI